MADSWLTSFWRGENLGAVSLAAAISNQSFYSREMNRFCNPGLSRLVFIWKYSDVHKDFSFSMNRDEIGENHHKPDLQ